MKTWKLLCLALLLAASFSMGQTLDRHLYGGVLLDDKMNFGGGCTTCSVWSPLFGWISGECCLTHLCNQDHGAIKNLLHLTNPSESDTDFEVDVYYAGGTQSVASIAQTVPARGKVYLDMDTLFNQDTKAQVIVSSENPLEATLETLTQRPPLTGDPEVIFSAGSEVPLVPFTSTRWRSGFVRYNDDEDWRSVLYVMNPTDATAAGQIRFTRGGQVPNEYNVNWETCQWFTLPAKGMLQLDLLDLAPPLLTSFTGFVEVDTGSALTILPNCQFDDPLGGSVVPLVIARQGADLDGMPCPPVIGQPDFAEPIHADPLYPQELRLP